MKKEWTDEQIAFVEKLHKEGLGRHSITKEYNAKFKAKRTPDSIRHALSSHVNIEEVIRETAWVKAPKILLFDIETSPLEVYTFGLFDQNIGLNQIIKDWSVLSFSAKWAGSSEVIYFDTSKKKDIRNDKKVVQEMWKLLDDADIVITQNGIRFDVPKMQTKFFEHGLTEPSSFRHIDLLRINRGKFKHTSNKLEFITNKYCHKFKKSGHKKFPGFELWRGCLDKNQEAWEEMEAYNKIDVLSMEEFYYEYLRFWDKSINYNVFTPESSEYMCSCGSTDFKKHGFVYTNTGVFQRFICRNKKCGMEHRGGTNLLSKEKRKSLKK